MILFAPSDLRGRYFWNPRAAAQMAVHVGSRSQNVDARLLAWAAPEPLAMLEQQQKSMALLKAHVRQTLVLCGGAASTAKDIH